MKSERWQKGWNAEEACKVYLEQQGYTIIAHRLRTPAGEIDIVAAQDSTLIIIEVKARKDIATALESISPKQRRRIEQATLYFLSENPDYQHHDIRIDCMVALDGQPPYHMQNAWILGE